LIRLLVRRLLDTAKKTVLETARVKKTVLVTATGKKTVLDTAKKTVLETASVKQCLTPADQLSPLNTIRLM